MKACAIEEITKKQSRARTWRKWQANSDRDCACSLELVYTGYVPVNENRGPCLSEWLENFQTGT